MAKPFDVEDIKNFLDDYTRKKLNDRGIINTKAI
jgi:hypothetical protein